MPPIVSMLIIALTACLVWTWTKPQTRVARHSFYAGLGCFLLIYWTPIAAWITWPLETAYNQHVPTQAPQSMLIVLLSGAERTGPARHDGDPTLNDQNGRYLEALRLLQAYPDTPFVFAGGYSNETTTDRAIAREVFNRAGQALRFSDIGDAGNTFENARDVELYLRQQPHLDRVLLVTSATHMPRAVLCFEAFDIDVSAAPAIPLMPKVGFWQSWTRYGAGLDNFLSFERAIHEWIGLAYYRLRGRTQAFWPQ